jgi:hypothetical protein
MPPEAVPLALACSIYPPAVAAVIALGRGADVRVRVVLLVASAFVTVMIVGTLLLLVLDELQLAGPGHHTPSAAIDVALGVLLIALAVRLRRRAARPARARPEPESSRTARYLESRPLVLLLGVVLYVVPSPIYLALVNSLADSGSSQETQVAYLALLAVLMLWMIELPMLALLARPVQGAAVLERANAWVRRHGRELATLAAALAGIYLLIEGLAQLLG